MKQRKFCLLIFIIFLFNNVYSQIITNLCTNIISCNCTLYNNTNLNIICNSTISLTELPILIPNTLQTNILELSVHSSISNTRGPLISLPTNICSYPNIQILDLSYNNINGLLNTSQLSCLSSKLLSVDFSSNLINEIEKNFFISNRNIQIINFSNNNLTTMPLIDGNTFVNFPSSITLMNFSSNQILSVDLWPLFVKTGNLMTIDLSYNLIEDYTNTVPILIEQFSETPDRRYFYLNNNRIEYLSDLLLEQYGACSTVDSLSTAFFIVGISNILLTDNPLICDCQSYNIITFINDRIDDFPEILNQAALLTKTTCSQPATLAGLPYLSVDFDIYSNCENYILPNITDIFCSLTPNDTSITMTPPTYWPSTTTTISSGNGGNSDSTNQNANGSSVALSWYIILGVVLGLVVIVATFIGIGYFFRDKLIPKKYRSKLLNREQIDKNNPNNSYEPIIRNSELIYEKNLKQHRSSMATSMDESDEQKKGTLRSINPGLQSGQETQTNFPPIRCKPPSGRLLSRRRSQQKENTGNQNSPHRERKYSLPIATDVSTNTVNIVKGIPITSVPPKLPPIPTNSITNTNEIIQKTNISELNITPSKRAKALPPVKNGIFDDSMNENILNTSAGALVTSQRQRRRSSSWFRKQNQNTISPLPPRPQSMVTQKTIFDYDGSFDEDIPSIPTIESLSDKPIKSLRTVPLLNISVVPAWIDDNNDQETK